jgi:cytoskeletal protein RodZ
MSPFTTKPLLPADHLSQRLRQARENLGLSLDATAHQLNISKHYLQSLEEGAWQELPGEFYLKTFLKKYALALGFSWPKIEKEALKEIARFKKWQQPSYQHQAPTRTHLMVLPKIIQKIFIFSFVVVLLVYLGLKIYPITQPPILIIFSPTEEKTISTKNELVVSGQTEKNTVVKINSQEVFPDETGYFSLTLDLSMDLNLIKIEAKKRYSPSVIINREVIVNNVNNTSPSL